MKREHSAAKDPTPSEEEEETRRAESIDQPPNADEGIKPSKIYRPLAFPVLALLAPASIFGVLARLGLESLMTYDGHSVFPLAYVQAMGCLIMGMALRLKEPLGELCVLSNELDETVDAPSVMALCTPPLQQVIGSTFILSYSHSYLLKGFCGSLTTFSSWQLDIFNAWINAGQFNRGGFHDVSYCRGISR